MSNRFPSSQSSQVSHPAQTARVQRGGELPSECENAPDGQKFASRGPRSRGAAAAGELPQSSSAPGDTCESQFDEEAWRADAQRRIIEIEAQQRAEEPRSTRRGKLPVAPQIGLSGAEVLQGRRGRGRPTIVDEEMQHKIVALLGAGASLTQTAAHVGVARNTILNALERDDEFAEQVHEARQRAQLFPLNCLLREAAGNWRAAAWLLSYLERKTEQERCRRERVFDAADQEIERDLVQELREDARRQRQQSEDNQSDDGEQPGRTVNRPGRQRGRANHLPASSSESSRAVAARDDDM